MKSERKTLLGLIAAGRMSATDAIRLESIWLESREMFWVVLLCVAAWAAQMNPGAWKSYVAAARNAVVQFVETEGAKR